jgi:hypothetical protein
VKTGGVVSCRETKTRKGIRSLTSSSKSERTSPGREPSGTNSGSRVQEVSGNTVALCRTLDWKTNQRWDQERKPELLGPAAHLQIQRRKRYSIVFTAWCSRSTEDRRWCACLHETKTEQAQRQSLTKKKQAAQPSGLIQQLITRRQNLVGALTETSAGPRAATHKSDRHQWQNKENIEQTGE